MFNEILKETILNDVYERAVIGKVQAAFSYTPSKIVSLRILLNSL